MKYQKLLYFLQNVGRDPSVLMQEDYLTGLKNRRFLLHYLKYAVDWDNLENHPVSLLKIDIDYFRRINEQYGHTVGDQALSYLAEVLKKTAGNKGTPILYAGDEFMLLLPKVKKHNALIAGAELVEHVNDNLFFSSDAGTEIPITISVGVATAPDDAKDYKGLVNQVNNALYHAKQSGRNQYADAAEVARQAVQYLDSASIVGRKSQFQQVNKALKGLGDGASQFVIVDGASGMGKTSFLDIVHRNLEKTKLHCLRVSGVTQESFRPYYLVSYIVMELMNQREDKGVGILDDMDEKVVKQLSHIIPQLAESDVRSPEIDDRQREEIFRSFIKFFISMIDDKQLALLVDDLDYSDPASLHLLRIMIQEKSITMFICGTATKESKSEARTIPLDLFRSAYSESLGIQDIRLTPLTGKDIEKHIMVTFPGIAVPQRLSKELAQITQGTPLFVEEILRKMIKDQKIVQSGQQWKMTKVEKGYFPKSLEDIVRNKFISLDHESRQFLEGASAFGESISLSMLTGVSEEKSAMVHDFLNRVIDQGIVKTDFKDNDETIRFLSKSIQGAIYDRINPDQKKTLHEQIGNYQEKLYKHNLLPSASFLAHHYKRSDNKEKAKEYEQLQTDINKRIFNDKEVERYAIDTGDDAYAEEIGNVQLSDLSKQYIPKLLQAMLITMRNTRLYPAESDLVVSSVKQLKQLLEKVVLDVERLSIITEKNNILLNGHKIEVGNFQAIAQKVVDFWDRLQMKSLTFVQGFNEKELQKVLQRMSRVEKREIVPNFWQAFTNENKLTHIFPRQVKYTKVEKAPEEDAESAQDFEEEVLHDYSELVDKELDASEHGLIIRVISVLLGAHSKLKLYPPDGPVAKEAVERVMTELQNYFKTGQSLTIAHAQKSILINGIKLDTSRFEALGMSLIKYLTEAKLSSITFLQNVTMKDLMMFIALSSEQTDEERQETFWPTVAEEKKIETVLINQRVYEVQDVSAEEEEEEEVMEEDLELDDSLELLPGHLQQLFMSGDLKRAAVLLKQLLEKFKIADETEKKKIIKCTELILAPEDWRPNAAYMKFVISNTMPLFELEVSLRFIGQTAALLHSCSEVFILFGEYTLATWVLTQIQRICSSAAIKGIEVDEILEKPIDPKAAEVVIEDLKSEDRSRQQDAFQLLSNLGNRVIHLLIDMVKREGNMRVRRMCAELIKNCGQEGVDLFKQSLMSESRPEYRARLLDVIDSVTTDLMMELSDTISDNSDVVRRSAFRMAERLGSPGVNRLLIELAKGDDPGLAASAINSIGKLNSPGAVNTLIAIAEKSDNNDVLVAVCRAMGQIADASFMEMLEKFLIPKRKLFFQKKYDTSVRVAAVYAVSQIKDPRAATLLSSLSEDSDYRVREVLKNIKK
jgi:diguanylate cyclase (GGDEF)-like protein